MFGSVDLHRTYKHQSLKNVKHRKMCIIHSKYKYKMESITSYSSFTLQAIIRLRDVYEKLSVINGSNSRTVGGTLLLIGCHEELLLVAAFNFVTSSDFLFKREAF